MSRYVPDVRVRRSSPNHSSRAGVAPALIVLHSTESANLPGTNRDLVNIADYLSRPEVKASSHVIVDGDGHSARLVADERAAWTQRAYNRASLSVEQIGRAASESWTEAEVREAARWVARWSKRYGIPLRRAEVHDGRVVRAGVTTHRALGELGGGHVDPGDRYPFTRAIELARFYRSKLG